MGAAAEINGATLIVSDSTIADSTTQPAGRSPHGHGTFAAAAVGHCAVS
jgi:hypothetical protein